MVTFNNKIPELHRVPLNELDESAFFESEGEIYQLLYWSDDDGFCNCVAIPSMNYVGFQCTKLVRPVDVDITVTGYTKE